MEIDKFIGATTLLKILAKIIYWQKWVVQQVYLFGESSFQFFMDVEMVNAQVLLFSHLLAAMFFEIP